MHGWLGTVDTRNWANFISSDEWLPGDGGAGRGANGEREAGDWYILLAWRKKRFFSA